MTEEAALLFAVRTNPDDDTARLVYADWLTEHGREDRAEFIRVQVDLARLTARGPLRTHLTYYTAREQAERDPPGCDSPACTGCDLLRRERELLVLDASQGWNGFLIDGMARHLIEHRMEEDAVWRRGFIAELHAGTDGCDMPRVMQLLDNPSVVLDTLTCSAADFLRHGDAIRAAHPVRRVILTTHPHITVKYEDPDEQYVLGEQPAARLGRRSTVSTTSGSRTGWGGTRSPCCGVGGRESSSSCRRSA